MTVARKMLAGCVAVMAVGLAGCASGPSHEQVIDRFAIEASAVLPGDPDEATLRELAGSLAEGADEDCVSESFWRVATSPSNDKQWDSTLQYIWAASCLALYGDRVSDGLRNEYAHVIAAHVAQMDD